MHIDTHESGEINSILSEGHGLESTVLNMYATEAAGIGPSGQTAACSALVVALDVQSNAQSVHTRFPALKAIPKLNASWCQLPVAVSSRTRARAKAKSKASRSLHPSDRLVFATHCPCDCGAIAPTTSPGPGTPVNHYWTKLLRLPGPKKECGNSSPSLQGGDGTVLCPHIHTRW